MRVLIKKIYMIVIAIFNVIFRGLKVKNNNIVVMMTFPKDVLPIIDQLRNKGYKLTVITTDKHAHHIQHLSNVTYVKAGNKNVIKHIKALSTAKVILIDTYYLIMGAYDKKAPQTVIQTWHAAGALKDFGLTDHQVDLNNQAMVNQYQRVYSATDLYLVGGDEMGHCFNESFDAQPSQMLRSGLPRLVEYLNIDIKEEQQRLKEQYGIQGKLAVYMPTYRENHQANRQINTSRFEKALPEYTLLSHLHPSIKKDKGEHDLDSTTLLIMADLIISDYSSIPIEASLLNKPTLFYVYDEKEYEKIRGLNQYYYDIPNTYKVTTEEALIDKIKQDDKQFKSLFNHWHKYTTQETLNQVTNYIDKLVKS
ncbi:MULTISPECIES: teichoic acid glycerol-phosphate primase TarB [Staphylococcus]|uniref:teichoic acid glycerol-phosphate primase TarB n=1 Tax=Staphylococcus TaxID=1279 RepID=UPI00024637CF|nr:MULTISPECIES: teichoic acid glycerol-phosphate primase TarB [Staphylococcus]MCR4455711.1 CDP-glycerol glycerophosphotransferase family protein [Aeromonas salmonicida]QAV31142.1 CDP-glycerol--poly(glycerophosphate) glycerophosphotransferase [Sulfitobacter donghicola]AGZ26023.1 teichoic acid biosynthesis protein B [Staphylococcus pasteuri SP1]KAB7646753.1 CDP-glycerol glycerophosphotransferase family protein [Staphylococcus sp. B2-b]MBN6853637.1 CDP-glycerol glycerophosphotransferase family p